MPADDKNRPAGMPGASKEPRAPSGRASQNTVPTEPHAGPNPLPNPLKDGLKATATPPSPGDDSERTALISRREARSKMWLLQDALKAVESALGPNAMDTKSGDELPPTQANRSPVRQAGAAAATPVAASPRATGAAPDKTQMVRGPQKPARRDFSQDPVAGWLVIIGGPGLGCFRPVFEGNNTIGRSASQRVPLDFGDDTISGEEQAFIRYDSSDREFLFVPNLAKTNVVSVNQAKPTSAVKLAAMDVITIGRTQLVFVPFCGEEFDWSDLADLKE
jgi:hypothetical protein